MGMFFHAKCPNCWDPEPCGCSEDIKEAARSIGYGSFSGFGFARAFTPEEKKLFHRACDEAITEAASRASVFDDFLRGPSGPSYFGNRQNPS